MILILIRLIVIILITSISKIYYNVMNKYWGNLKPILNNNNNINNKM